MKMRWMLLCLSALALASFACGDDGGGSVPGGSCETLCATEAKCALPGFDETSCVGTCQAANWSSEMLGCMGALSCDAFESGDRLEACLPKEQEAGDCREACRNFLRCDPDGEEFSDEDLDGCALGCSYAYSPAQQRCLAGMKVGCGNMYHCLSLGK